jgi:acyl carrier protein
MAAIDVKTVWGVVVDVKPSVAEVALDAEASLIQDLGLDSLDLLQLGRRLQRVFAVPFVMEQWLKQVREQHGRATLQALVAALEAAKAAA